MKGVGWPLLLNDDRTDPEGFLSRRLSLSRPYSQLNVIGFPVAPSDAPIRQMSLSVDGAGVARVCGMHRTQFR